MGQLAASDSTSKTSSLDRLKLAASRLLKRTPKPSSSMTAAVAPSSPPPSQQAPPRCACDNATRGGKAAARSLARLSATSMVSADEDEAATAGETTDAAVENAVVPFPLRKSKNDDDDAKPETPADVAAGRFSLGLPRDLDAKYDLSDKILGSGGSGTVHLATCKRTGKTVAVKTIPKVSLEKNGGRSEKRSQPRRQQRKKLCSRRKLSAPTRGGRFRFRSPCDLREAANASLLSGQRTRGSK